jgi:DNA-binding NtrC family response regulator
MAQEGTVPIRSSGVAVRVIRVEVVAGPDAGKSQVASSDTVRIGTAEGNDLVLGDPTVSRFHLELRRTDGRIQVEDLGSTNGTRIGPVLLSRSSAGVDAGSVLEIGGTSLRLLDGEIVTLEDGPAELGEIRGTSPAIRRLMATAQRVAKSEVSVLLLGESGTGKELVARAIHDASARASEPFVTVDCAAIAPTLFASELFGHERGAFTGAERQHIGAFERANGGSVFLDEIGELGPELQSALLGVLERRKLRRVGGRQDLEIDVRLISATHRDLRAQVNAGSFRLDLFYRIAVVLLELPPLRARASDIPLLIEHFLREAGHDEPIERLFPPAELKRLVEHSWPGNVRELRNVVLGTLALGEAPALGPPVQAQTERHPAPGSLLELAFRDAKRKVVDEFELAYVRALLERSGGNIRQAARDARMDRSYLMELVKRHRLKSQP